jgi:hypothetical protein
VVRGGGLLLPPNPEGLEASTTLFHGSLKEKILCRKRFREDLL